MSLECTPLWLCLRQKLSPWVYWGGVGEGVDVGCHDNTEVVGGSEYFLQLSHILQNAVGGGGLLQEGEEGGEESQLCHHTGQVVTALYRNGEGTRLTLM